MNKLKDTFGTAYHAMRYSFLFCWRNNKKDTIAGLFFLVLLTALGYLAVILMGQLVGVLQKIISEGRKVQFSFPEVVLEDFFLPITLMVIVLLTEMVLRKLSWYFSSRWRHTLRIANNRELNDHKASLDVARFRSKKFDDLKRKIEELPQNWYTRIGLATEMMDMFRELATLIVFGVSLLMFSPVYVAVIIGSSLLALSAEFKAVNKFWKLSLDLAPHHKKRHVLERAYDGVISFLQGLMFRQMPTLRKQIDENTDIALAKYSELRRSTLQEGLVTHFLAMAGLCAVLIHAIGITISTGGDIGALTVLIASAKRLQGSMIGVVSQIAENWNAAKGTIMIEREFFGTKPLLQTINPVSPTFAVPPTIRFENVSFVYPDTDKLVLRNVNLTIESGSRVAIVGKNGSGKSSLVALLLRHYDPTSGKICVGDLYLRNIIPSSWRDSVSALTQEYSINDRSVGEEIASSRLDSPIDSELISEGSRFACFDEVMNSDPKGYDSQIGTEFGGREFSGGEEQRLALARVKYRNTPILILDEPDAKLDPETAQKVINNIFSLRGVTVIIITQHLSRATACDKVVVMHEGEIVEQGTPVELMRLQGRYASMFKKDKERLGG